MSVSALDGTNGFRVSGAAAGDHAGSSVSRAGDTSGDGLADLIVGAPEVGAADTKSGAAYIVFGKRNGFPSDLSLSELESANGITFLGRPSESPWWPGDKTGVFVHPAGDVNRDGVGDITISYLSANNGTQRSLGSYVVYGSGFGPDWNGDLSISANGQKAKFTDADGDLVKVTTTKGTFVPENFLFSYKGPFKGLDLTVSSVDAFTNAHISISATTPPDGHGDGLVEVAKFDAEGANLRSVKIDGALGFIKAGAGVLGEVALGSLVADSLGVNAPISGSYFDLGSIIAGELGRLKIRHDVEGVLTVTGGAPMRPPYLSGPPQISDDVVGEVFIGGSLVASEARGRAALLHTYGGIGSILAKGSVIGGADHREINGYYSSGIAAGGSIGPVSVQGNWAASSLLAAESLKSIVIKGAVSGSDEAGDQFEIRALHIGKARIAGDALALTDADDNFLLDPVRGDFRLRD